VQGNKTRQKKMQQKQTLQNVGVGHLESLAFFLLFLDHHIQISGQLK
jgi:hypothetical protein